MKKMVFILFLVVMFVVAGCTHGNDGSGVKAKQAQSDGLPPDEVIIDVNQFSLISPEALVEIMGEPESIEKWTYKSSSRQLPVVTYSYEKSEIEFQIVENTVARLNYTIPVDSSNLGKLMQRFGLNERTLKKHTDTGTTLSYYTTTKSIHEVYIMLDKSKTSLFRVDYKSGLFQ
jgi:hypothetical protein